MRPVKEIESALYRVVDELVIINWSSGPEDPILYVGDSMMPGSRTKEDFEFGSPTRILIDKLIAAHAKEKD